MKIVKFEFSLFGINTYIVYDPVTLKCAIIDPGMINAEEENAMKEYIEKNNLNVTHIINTHLHVDHAAGNKYASETFKAPIFAHSEDEFLGKRLQMQAQAFGIMEKIDDVSLTSYLTDGERIEIGEGVLEVIHVPGHSPGSIALYDPDGGYVIAGDALFAGSVGRTDLPGGDMNVLLKAVKDKLFALPDETVVYAGHGSETTIGTEKNSNPFFAYRP